MKKGCKRAYIFGLTVILISMLFAAGQAVAESKVPDVVTIKVGGVETLSGGGATWHEPGARAELFYWEQFNKKGGMAYTEPDGSKHRFVVEYKYEDCNYKADKAATSYGRMRDWGAHVVTVHGTTPAAAIVALAARDQVPVVQLWACNPDPKSYRDNLDKQYLLPCMPANVNCTLCIFKAIKDNIWDKKHAGEPYKVGVIAFDNPPRRLYKNPEIKEIYAKAGIDLVGVEIVPISITDATMQVKRLYDLGAKVIQIDHITAGSKVIVEAAERMGIRDKIIFSHWYLLLRDFLTMPELFDGDLNPWPAPPYNVPNPNPEAVAAAKPLLSSDPDYWMHRIDWGMSVYVVLDLTMQAVKNTLEKYGYSGLTRERLREALFKLKEVKTPFYPTFNIDARFPYTTPYMWLNRVDTKNKVLQPIGMPVAPGPGLYQPAWNPSDNKNVVVTDYYQWP